MLLDALVPKAERNNFAVFVTAGSSAGDEPRLHVSEFFEYIYIYIYIHTYAHIHTYIYMIEHVLHDYVKSHM